ncbi:MAG: AMP-binding protein [Alphaproteobacteria bacterium]|nr:AMP-binding protein [Alphaproteobacteria bacterium]MCB9697200.1 AMP-binding protein [Alphaproteobacteria bacterium]
MRRADRTLGRWCAPARGVTLSRGEGLEPNTLVDLARGVAEGCGDLPLYTWLADGRTPSAELDAASLDRRARALAAGLVARDLGGRRVVLGVPAGLDFVVGLLGCLYAGAVAVPVPLARRGAARERAAVVVRRSGAAALLVADPDDPAADGLHPVTLGLAVAGEAEDWRPPAIVGADPAIVQYTSGSTGDPKGVVLAHGQILANLAAIAHGVDVGPGVCWLPPQHDMGLVGGVLHGLWRRAHTALLPPLEFLKNPATWLLAVTRYRAEGTPCPDFGLRHCLDRVGDEVLPELDLSSLRLVYCGAEPVRADTLARFAERFGPRGFDPRAFAPCYGLAEATLVVTCARAWTTPRTVVDGARTRVSCGTPAPGTEVRVVVDGRVVPDRVVGEIWVRGPSVSWGTLEGDDGERFDRWLEGEGRGWLATGDLGLLDDGELVVTGRRAELLLVRGRNVYAHDVERAAAAVAGGELACAFAVERGEEEDVVLVVEAPRRPPCDLDALARGAWEAVRREAGFAAARVVVVGPRRIPRTTSGKPRRATCREQVLAGLLPTLCDWAAP